eukprot:CAMPEP_0182924910 /NCGR_PEP_ID=MMETSP0105_2-20130417/7980_1 /TAXON_ID=81532 ORGANISM="Acanthoeca-like sp., Strain 10tr" /NCGR_SAMPLE_ID=MMETSP0105_2 /ASSEMBLY_ACC=CAM_ASM_000205 /LENGTH=220 /DNA_ID=CAMNT_0025062731 /DNA_START=30 /DNA_END=692 /DNA_ORIENTATION=-
MAKESGPTYGQTAVPMISTAGKEHVVFSKRLVAFIALILGITGCVFFVVEQSKIQGNLASSRQALVQNNNIRATNEKLSSTQIELQDEEDELVNMYSKWLDEDSEELEVSNEELAELREQLKSLMDASKAHNDSIYVKDNALSEKEERLHSYQFKIQQKQDYLDQMADILKTLNQTAPDTSLDSDETKWVWDDDFVTDTEDGSFDYYTGDDDWMSDELWY